MKGPKQVMDAVLPTFSMRILLEHGNGPAEAILGHDELETLVGVDSLIESDVDDGFDALARGFLLDGCSHRLRLPNRAKIRPRSRPPRGRP